MELKRKQIERFEPISVREEMIEAQVEAVIPDSYSDVVRVAATYGNIAFKDKNAGTDRITLNGVCNAQLLCITEEHGMGEIITVNVPVSHVVSVQGVTGDSTVVYDAKVTECAATPLNSRKVSVRAKILLTMTVYNNSSLWLTTELPENENNYSLYRDFHDEFVSFVAEKQLRLVENISLETEQIKPFRWSVDFISEDVRIIKDKVMIRGTCQLRVLFINTENGELTREKYHLPFSSVIENEGFKDVEDVQVEYMCPCAEVTAGSVASGYSLNCDVVTNIYVTAKKQMRERILADVFNSRYELDTKWETLSGVMKISTEGVKKDLANTFENVNNADKVCDFTYTVTSRISGKIVYAAVLLNIIYKDTLGETYQAVCQFDTEQEMANTFYAVKAEMGNISLQCTENGNIRMEGEMVFTVNYGNTVEVEQVSACNLLKDTLKTKKNSATLVLRKIAKGETVWDIAKKYNTSPEAISQANKMDDSEQLSHGKLIMIPIVK